MYIRVHAVPSAKKEKVTRDSEAVFTIAVKEPAERNCANKRIREIVARECGVTPQQVTLLTGHRSCSKMYSVEVE